MRNFQSIRKCRPWAVKRCTFHVMSMHSAVDNQVNTGARINSLMAVIQPSDKLIVCAGDAKPHNTVHLLERAATSITLASKCIEWCARI